MLTTVNCRLPRALTDRIDPGKTVEGRCDPVPVTFWGTNLMNSETPCCPRPQREAAATPSGLEQFVAVSTLFDAAEMVLYVADMDTHELLFMNTHAERIWGHRIGEPCYRVLQKDRDQPCEFCTNPRLTDTGSGSHPVVWEFQNTRDGRWYLCIDKAIPWPDGRRVRMEVAIDVTERKLHEQFREQYVGLISHDLRTPISTIVLSATLLKLLNERAGSDQGAAQVESILRNARRLAAMIEDLLETTRLESGRIELHKSEFDLAALAATVSTQLGSTATRAIRCEARAPTPVLADAGRIERVLENLIGNAFRYSPPDAPVQVTVEAGEHETVVAVADCGIGIPADELPKLFQRFARASGHDAERGLGLGLYNSRLIIEHHGGRIWADSAPGAGSTFAFSVPVGQIG
jgi:two-component system, OmpR family, phosphate regulon sensor histidine kinase PhoR